MMRPPMRICVLRAGHLWITLAAYALAHRLTHKIDAHDDERERTHRDQLSATLGAREHESGDPRQPYEHNPRQPRPAGHTDRQVTGTLQGRV